MVRAQECPIANSNADKVIGFLWAAKNDSTVKPECIIAAIRTLQYVRSKVAINVLVEYLEFKRPADGVATGSNSDPYPATSSLFAIGLPALPALFRVIAQTQSSNVARDNAVETVMSIYRDDPAGGIKFLLSEAARCKDPGDGALIRQAASSAVRWCQGKDRTECELASSSQ